MVLISNDYRPPNLKGILSIFRPTSTLKQFPVSYERLRVSILQFPSVRILDDPFGSFDYTGPDYYNVNLRD